MTNLRHFLTELGFENVRSVLQSGNLVFGSRSRFGAELERYLEMEAVKRLALESDFYVRTAEEWKSVIRQNPFRKEGERDPGYLIVLFLKNAPTAKDVAHLQADISGPELVKAKGKQAYIFYPNGIGRSKLTNRVRIVSCRSTPRPVFTVSAPIEGQSAPPTTWVAPTSESQHARQRWK